MKMKKILFGSLVFTFLAVGALISSADAAILLVDDFDDCAKPNAIGGNYGAWDKDPNDTTQTCIDSFDGDIKYGLAGYSLKLEYDVDSPNPAYNGFWMDLGSSDLRKYNSLVFYVKGDSVEGYTSQFNIELKNSVGEKGTYLVTGVTDRWQKVIVPFRKIDSITDWRNITQAVIVFDDLNCTDKDGVLYIDNITFETL
jgi:hypothetical protein